MEKILIGYKQGDNSYVYVANIDNRNINVTTTMEGAIDFNTVEIAKNVCEFLNSEDTEHVFTAIKITINIEEVKL